MRTRSRRLLTPVAVAGVLALTAAAAPAADGTRHQDTRNTQDTRDILAALKALPGLRVIEERPAQDPGYRFFVLGLRQPVDHTAPSAGTFEQRLTLLHKATDRPTVLFTTGYEVPLSPRRAEPTEVLDGNQIGVEHRFFGTSRPATVDWSRLTVRQAADDHHRVVRLFKRLYRGAWLSTGGSKGGTTSVHHRRFHPDDVDGTVAYGAPNHVDDRDDSAYLRFFETVGTPVCRAALRTAQRELLLRREELVARYTAWAESSGATFRLIGGADKAFETAVLRVPLMFWQYRGVADCATVPGPDATSEELYTWLATTAVLSVYTDASLEATVPYFYQAGTQLGYLAVPTAHLAGLLRHPDAIAPRNFVPRHIPLRFDHRAMPDIDRWVREHGDRLLFLHGTDDPSVADRFHPGGHDSRAYWAPNTNHRVRLTSFSPEDRAAITTTILRWASPD